MFKKIFKSLKQKLIPGRKVIPTPTKANVPPMDIPKLEKKIPLKVRRTDRRKDSRSKSIVFKAVKLIMGEKRTVLRRRGVAAFNPPGTKRIPPTMMPFFDGRYLQSPGTQNGVMTPIIGRRQRGGYCRKVA